MKKYHLIYNPISGRGNGGRLAPSVQSRLKELGLVFESQATEYPGHAIQLANQAALRQADVVIAMGGDGTANEVLNGLMQASPAGGPQPAMGVISVGRGNDFAYGLGLPTGWEEACQVIAAGAQKWMDVGFVQGGLYPQGRFFGNGVGIGFDAVVGFEALKLKWLSGFPSYIVAAVKTISLYFNAPLVRIELDGETITLNALMVSIMNGRRMGGGFMMAPQGVNDDGLFDLCVASQVSRMEIIKIMPLFMKGTQASHPAILTRRSASVRVTALQGSLPAHSDGETLCEAGESLEARIYPRAIQMVVPLAGSLG